MVPENSRFRYAEAAAYLGLKDSTLRVMVYRHEIPHIRVTSRLVLFEKDALDAWLDARRVPATAQE